MKPSAFLVYIINPRNSDIPLKWRQIVFLVDKEYHDSWGKKKKMIVGLLSLLLLYARSEVIATAL